MWQTVFVCILHRNLQTKILPCSCVAFLLELGLDVNAVNDEGNTPLILATICLAESAAECAEVLIRHRHEMSHIEPHAHANFQYLNLIIASLSHPFPSPPQYEV